MPVLYELQPFPVIYCCLSQDLVVGEKTEGNNTWVRVPGSELLKELLCFYYLGVRETLSKWLLKVSMTNSASPCCVLLLQVELSLVRTQ